MFERILVAVDGSDSAISALRQALSLARSEKSAVYVLAVVPPYEGDLRLVGVRGHVRDVMREPFEKALAEAVAVAGSLRFPVKPILLEGEPPQTIVDLADAHGADLIVAGVRGRNPAERLLLGSMVSRVIGYSRTHVMVCPRNSEIGLGKVIVAFDSSESATGALALAFDFAREYGSHLDVLSVADVPSHLYGVSPAAAGDLVEKARRTLEKAEHHAADDDVSADFLLLEGDSYDIILETSRQKNAGLIIMGSHGRTGIRRLLMGSVTERVIGHAPCPVIVARAY
jgi:nucleotide-binding universal stress UspA family protein